MAPDDPAAPDPSPPEVEGAAPGKVLSPAARRALEEAAARRAAEPAESPVSAHPKGENPEAGGPTGPEPTRYGDWERKGLAVDF